MTLPSRNKIRTLAVWGRTRYLSVTEALHNIESLRVSGEETFSFFETWRSERGSNPRSLTFQAGSFNHGTRAPTHNAQYTTYSIASIVPYFKLKLNSLEKIFAVEKASAQAFSTAENVELLGLYPIHIGGRGVVAHWCLGLSPLNVTRRSRC